MKNWMLLLVTFCMGVAGCSSNQVLGDALKSRTQRLTLETISVNRQLTGETVKVLKYHPSERYDVEDGSSLEFRFLVSNEDGPVVGREVYSSSLDRGGITRVTTDSNGRALLEEPVGGARSTLGPVTRVIEDASILFRAQGGGDVLVKFRLFPKGEMGRVSGGATNNLSPTVTPTAPTTTPVVADNSITPTLKITGLGKRVEAVAKHLRSKGANVEEFSGPEVMGTLKDKPWPGVQVRTEGEDDAGVFVPVSDSALKKGLCADQETVLNALVPSNRVVEKKVAAITPKNASGPQFCNQLLSGSPVGPYRLVADKKEIVLKTPRQSENISFWVEDSAGRQISHSEWKWVVEDGTYLKRQPATADGCQKGSYVKLWDDDPATGRPWLPAQVAGKNGKIVITVSDGSLTPVVIPWKVEP